MAIRLRLREVLTAKRISERELARRSGIHLKNISWLCNHPNQNITLATLNKLAQALKVEPQELIDYKRDQ